MKLQTSIKSTKVGKGHNFQACNLPVCICHGTNYYNNAEKDLELKAFGFCNINMQHCLD